MLRSFPLDKMWYNAPFNSMCNGLAIELLATSMRSVDSF